MATLSHTRAKRRPKYQSITLRYLKFLWFDRLTRGGRVLLAGIALSGVGLVSVQAPIYQLFCLLTALYLAVWCAGMWFRPRVIITGKLTDRTVAGERIRGTFRITNARRRAAFDLCAGMTRLPAGLVQTNLDAAIPALGGGASVEMPVELQAERRGLYELPDLRVYTTFPFGLLRSGSARHALGSLVVLPAYHAVERVDVPFAQRYQPGGVALTSNIGESPEYIGNREYIPGEPARRIDFRSWARLGRPVVREYQEEYYCRIALVLDTFVAPKRKSRPAGFPELEAAISLAATAANALSSGEYLLDVFAAGPELYVFRSGRHTAHFENILEILACLDACRSNPFETVAPAVAEEIANLSTAICILLDWDEDRRTLVRTIQEAGCAVKVLLVRDGPPTLPLDGEDVPFSSYTPAEIARGGFDAL